MAAFFLRFPPGPATSPSHCTTRSSSYRRPCGPFEGASLYVRNPINTLHLADFECLPSRKPRAGLSHYHAALDTTLHFLKASKESNLRQSAYQANALPIELDAIHSDERVPMLHTLLRYRIHSIACLSPAGYSTVLQDRVAKAAASAPHPIELRCRH